MPGKGSVQFGLMLRLFRIIDSSDPEQKLNAARDSSRLVIKDSDPYLVLPGGGRYHLTLRVMFNFSTTTSTSRTFVGKRRREMIFEKFVKLTQ